MKNIAYIDAANLIKTIAERNLDFDYLRFLVYLKENRKINACKFFIADFKFNLPLITELKNYGVEVISKKIYFDNTKIKANCDVEIAHEVTKDILEGAIDQLLLVSGDGDFLKILEYAELQNKKPKLIAVHPQNTSKIYKSMSMFGLMYITQIIYIISKRKALPEHNNSARVIFDNPSIPIGENLSIDKGDKNLVN